jgi:protein SCO1/2
MLNRRNFLKATAAVWVTGSSGILKANYFTSPRISDSDEPSRIIRHYEMPDVPLMNQNGDLAHLHNELQREGPVLLDFIFTTCAGICPILSATFSRTADLLGEDTQRTRLWSISIDPDYDTPERLTNYRKQFRANEHWQFFTGPTAAIKSIRQAFNTDSDNKMAHQSLVLLRLENSTWIRFEGNINAEHLAAEVRRNLHRR